MLWYIFTEKLQKLHRAETQKSINFANPITTSRFDVKKNLTGLIHIFCYVI
jgi:hypothetical protein